MNNLQTNENKKNKLVNTIKSKIQIININENSKPYSSTKYNVYIPKGDKDIIIICAQNSLNATKETFGGNHFPEQFGKKLINEGFELFSKIDATPMKKRTSGGFSTSNVRTRIYVKNVEFDKLENQNEKKKHPINYLKKSHPNGNSTLPFGKRIDENTRHFKQKINSQYNENNKLKIIEFKTYKKYYHNQQGIIKTTLVLKYNECLYGLYIINMGESITQPKNSKENSKENSKIEYNTKINTIKPTCDCNVIKLNPKKKIKNNNLNISTNNIGKNNIINNKTPTNEETPLLQKIKQE